MNAKLRWKALELILFFGSIAGYYLVVPSLERAGFSVPGAAPVILLVLIGLSIAMMIIGALASRHRPQVLVLSFGLVPAVLGIEALLQLDSRGMLSALVAAGCVLALAVAPEHLSRFVFEIGIAVLVTASIFLATVDPRFAIAGRDYLPVIIDGRAFGILGYPNSLAIWSAVLLLSAISWNGLRRGLFVAIGVLGLLAAASQTALLGVAVALIVAITWNLLGRVRPRLRVAFGVPALTVLSVLAVTLLPSVILHANVDLTFTGRTTIWASALRQDAGWLGLTDAEFTSWAEGNFGLGSAHDLWIETWLRGGVVGLAVVCLFTVWMLVRIIRASDASMRAIATLFIVTAMTEGVLLAMPLIVVFAAAIGAQDEDLVKRGSRERIGEPQRHSRRGPRRHITPRQAARWN